jgi:hypothetical protein
MSGAAPTRLLPPPIVCAAFLTPLRQIRAPGAAGDVWVPGNPARAVRLGLKVEQLRVNALAFDETVKRIATASAALVALDAQHVELAYNVAENDRAVSGHHNRA